MIQANENDQCSLKWTNHCTVPEWTDAILNDGNYCAAIVNINANTEMKNCSENRQFLCEINTGTFEMDALSKD